MCVICVQPAGKYLDKDEARDMWDANPHGGGFAYINSDNVIVTEKYMKFRKFWGAFERARSDNRDKDFIVHMRIATHGEVNLDNVHPFQVDEHTVLAHNGIIHDVEDDPTNEMSDTRIFIRDVLSEMPEKWLDSKYLAPMVAKFIGWSKMAFLTTDPNLEANVYLLNQSTGTWDNGMWYSNMNHKRTTRKFGNSNSTYQSPTNYKGGTAAGQVWDNEKRRWVDRTTTSVTPSEDKTYDSLKDYWDEKDEQDLVEAIGNELFLDKGGTTWKETDLPWSNTIKPDEKEKVSKIWDDLREVRGAFMYPKPIAYDDEFDYWWCYGCDEEVDVNTGACECWDKYCCDCSHIAAECECQAGYSHNLTNSVNVFDNMKRSEDDLPNPL